MRNALQLGATAEEVMEMLEITSLMGIDGVTTGLGQLMEEASTNLAEPTGGVEATTPLPKAAR
jgi:hypothetical protein